MPDPCRGALADRRMAPASSAIRVGRAESKVPPVALRIELTQEKGPSESSSATPSSEHLIIPCSDYARNYARWQGAASSFLNSLSLSPPSCGGRLSSNCGPLL